MFFIFTAIWGRFPFWLYFWKGWFNHQLEKTQFNMCSCSISQTNPTDLRCHLTHADSIDQKRLWWTGLQLVVVKNHFANSSNLLAIFSYWKGNRINMSLFFQYVSSILTVHTSQHIQSWGAWNPPNATTFAMGLRPEKHHSESSRRRSPPPSSVANSMGPWYKPIHGSGDRTIDPFQVCNGLLTPHFL